MSASPPSHPGRVLCALAALALGAGIAVAGCGRGGRSLGERGRAPASADPPGGGARAAEISSPEFGRLGAGFLVWESNRTGAWRIWTRRLDGSGLRQLTADERGREHCCAHIAPDGRWVAYLSLPENRLEAADEEGELRLITPDGAGNHVVAPLAATYSRGHRAAIWHADRRLQYIDGEGNAILFDLDSRKRETLAGRNGEGHGWLINRTLDHATTGLPTFSLYDAKRRTVTERTPYGGCEPYFSDDGRWGLWMAGAGGPIRALDLATRTSKVLFEKNDPRLGQQAYLYFPMLSNGSSILAFGASPNEHDHTKGNYDVFLVEVDPHTLEVLGQPLKYTSAPSSDRYPDVHVNPLPLGRAFGEAPFHVSLGGTAVGGGASWDYGDGTPAGPGTGEHTYVRTGSYGVTARLPDGRALGGRVTVRPAMPPHAVRAELRQGREIVVSFDEPIAPAPGGVLARLASGLQVVASRVGADERSLSIALASDSTRADRLHLEGVVDRAQRPNALVPLDLAIPPPRWPSSRQNLVLVWATADQPNLVADPSHAAERTYAFAARGRARLNHDQAMQLVGDGYFVAAQDAGASLVEVLGKSNEITFELTVTPAEAAPGTSGVVSSFAGSGRQRFLELEQRGDGLFVRLLRSREFEPPLRLGTLRAGIPAHVALGYSPGRVMGWMDGVKRLDSDRWQGDFFFWKPGTLTVGAAVDGTRPWRGVVEGVAIYDRLLAPEDLAENARRFAAERSRRPAVPPTRVTATALRCSHVPTLAEIAPYRQGLAVCEYRVERVLEGRLPASTVRVARWVILDGQTQPLTPANALTPLALEPFDANPELESLYISNDLGKSPAPLYYDPSS